MDQTDFETLLEDPSKTIDGDIIWADDEDHSPALEFHVPLQSAAGMALFVRGSLNALAHTLSFMIIHRAWGRIYGLDLGKEHHNPNCTFVGETHKHRWTERFRDKHAYAPGDVTAAADDPLTAWRQFCEEAKIVHKGVMKLPPPRQLDLL